ncbi:MULTISPECIES: FAD-dependent oxidoreductase [Sphingosinicellaceae]|uniref:FAD-dependent oxidoreductase n=1 Tax=Sphingosinicellaceae TaxID=2820280 RepID=UPI001C1E3CCE|nr:MULTISPECIES: FAD-dependent oxidoreductase [Polymorphobacter]QYE33490.1 FAD-binding protein [Polymorphobacter sp. PAMC 29334]UAJ12853.1 FAD-binding protein [Polymorphobacter megasporae]
MRETLPIWSSEYDVIVVGYGFAGATAAITACEAGAKVLLLEKAPETDKGGNSRVSANLVFWPNDIALGKAYFRALAGPYMDDISNTMVDVWATEMHANRAWLEDLGMTPFDLPSIEFPEMAGSECVRVLMNGPGPMGGERLWRVVEAAVAARDIDVLYESPAVNLVKAGDDIVGVITEQGGKRVAIKATRAVILTCGGFENNPAMVRNYVDGLPRIFPNGTPNNTGDGIRMGLEVGAQLWHMNNISGPLLSFKAPEIAVAQWLNLPHGKSYLFVAGDGSRFTMEGDPCLTGDLHGKVKRHGEWGQQVLPVPIYMIFDNAFRKSGHIGKAAADWDVSHGNLYNWSDDNLREVAKGWIKRADTFGELAALIDIPAAALEASVARFDGFATAGSDADWDRAANEMAPLAVPPYYAMELTPAFVNTQGGPRRNEHAQVIGVDGEPIGRLYSAGELGSIYSFLYQGGGNIGECFAFGRIAGRNAAAEAREVSPAKELAAA